MKRSENINELVAALAKAQREFKPIYKDTDNPAFRSKYADLHSIISATQPALNANGLVLIQGVECVLDNQATRIETLLSHVSGQWISDELFLPATMRDRFDAQAVGSSQTYGRRYAMQAILGVAADVDDDGNAAVGVGSKEAAQEVARRKIAEHEAKKAAPAAPDLTQKLQESIAATQKPAKPYDPIWDKPIDSRPLITKAEMGKKGGKAEDMLFVDYDGEKATVFDKAWFPYLKAGVQADMDLETVKRNGKSYVNITAIRSVGDVKAGPDGKPALDVNRPAGAIFDEQVAHAIPPGEPDIEEYLL